MKLYKIALVFLLAGAQTIWGATTKWTIDKVVDGTTKCPGTKGYFNPLSGFPAINGEWVVFLDAGDDGCAANDGPSIWSYSLTTKKLKKLVDTGTAVPVPKGVGKFTGFVPINNVNLQVNDGTVLFYGLDGGHNSKYTQCVGGLYTVPAGGGTIHRVVDYTMTLPGQGGYFCGLQNDYGITGIQGMSIYDGKVVFSAQSVGVGYANDGVWWAPAKVNTTEADIHLVADGSTLYHSPFPPGCSEADCWTIYEWAGGFIGGSTMAFTGAAGNPGPWGLFVNSIKDPILQSNYVLPGDNDPDTGRPDQTSSYVGPIVDGSNLFFIGSDPFYLGACAGGTFAGIFETTLSGGKATSIMNTCDDQPDGHKLGANSFNYVAANAGTAVFQVLDDVTGDYVLDSSVKGVVSVLIAPGDPLPSSASCDGAYHAAGCATAISPPGTGGLNDGHVVFTAEGGKYWYDEGVYIASLPCAADVTANVSIDLQNLTYNPAAGTWSQVAKITNTGREAIDGPVSLVLKDLPSAASPAHYSGKTTCSATSGSPYFNVSLPSNKLQAGESAQVTLEFSAASRAEITFTSQVAGAGTR
jgi:hypothetical protein